MLGNGNMSSELHSSYSRDVILSFLDFFTPNICSAVDGGQPAVTASCAVTKAKGRDGEHTRIEKTHLRSLNKLTMCYHSDEPLHRFLAPLQNSLMHVTSFPCLGRSRQTKESICSSTSGAMEKGLFVCRDHGRFGCDRLVKRSIFQMPQQ